MAQALTLTAATTDDLVRFAVDLTEHLPGTFAALSTGEIDYAKARTLWRGTDPALAPAIEANVLPKVHTQTTGEIRAKIRRLTRKLDPDAHARRRAAAERQRGVQLIETDDGTAYLTGTDLPTEAASAAYGRISAIAFALKNDGDDRGINQVRADVFVALLRGTLTAEPAPETTDPQTRPRSAEPADGRVPAHPGTGNARRMWSTRCSRHDRSHVNADNAMAVGWSAVDDGVADLIAGAARTELSALTGRLPERHRRLGALIAQAGDLISESLAPLKARWCVSDHGRTAYRPPATMRRLLEHRDRRCCFPGCRRPVRHCDADHSIPYQCGGPTCPCNLALLCRRHHRVKQTAGWRIHHLWPGVVLWITPTGHWSITAPADRE